MFLRSRKPNRNDPHTWEIYMVILDIKRSSIGCQTTKEPSKKPTSQPALAVARGSICSRMNCLCIKPLSGPTRVSRLLRNMATMNRSTGPWATNNGLVDTKGAKKLVFLRGLASSMNGYMLRRSEIDDIRHCCLYHHSMFINGGIYVIPYCLYYAILTSSHQPS